MIDENTQFLSVSDSIPYTPLHSPVVPEQCACGCNLNEESGEIIASGRCSLHSRWLITVALDHVIDLKFSYLNFFEDKQWVKVRDGHSSGSDLIAYSDGRQTIDHVTSSTNKMLVEFFTESADENNPTYSRVPTKIVHVHGFIATFTSNRKLTLPTPD